MNSIDTIREALILSESAMFHVLSDGGFNSPADEDAMRNAMALVRQVLGFNDVCADDDASDDPMDDFNYVGSPIHY